MFHLKPLFSWLGNMFERYVLVQQLVFTMFTDKMLNKPHSHHNIEVWRMVPLCLIWCIWREHNVQNFKDCERTVIELRVIMFKSLYVWMAAYNAMVLAFLIFRIYGVVFFYRVGCLSCIDTHMIGDNPYSNHPRLVSTLFSSIKSSFLSNAVGGLW